MVQRASGLPVCLCIGALGVDVRICRFQHVRTRAGIVMPMAEADVVVWYNPRCSKCRGAEQLLAAYGVPAQRVFYLDNPPARAEIIRVLALLGTEDPRALMRTAEPRYHELGLINATADELIGAMARYPELIQRPLVIWSDRAIIARPPELLLPLLKTGHDPASP
jgi:arsenate reductase (glutaredoxin)